MNSRVEHFTPPKGYRLGEWDEVAGWTHSPSTRNGGYPAFYKSYRIGQMESPGFATRVSFRAPAQRPVFWRGTARRRSWSPSCAIAPPHPGILYEYQNKGVAKLAFRKPLILKDAFSVACNS